MKKILAFQLFFALTVSSFAGLGEKSAVLDSLYLKYSICEMAFDVHRVRATNYYVAFYKGNSGNTVTAKTFYCTPTGDLGTDVVDSLSFGESGCVFGSSCESGSFELFFTNTGSSYKIYSFLIDDSGNIGSAPVDSLRFGTRYYYGSGKIKNLLPANSICVLTYSFYNISGGMARQKVKSISVNATTGALAVIDSANVSESFGTYYRYPELLKAGIVSEKWVALYYKYGNWPFDKINAASFSVSTAGIISIAGKDSLSWDMPVFQTTDKIDAVWVNPRKNWVLLAGTDPYADGYLVYRTFSVDTTTGAMAKINSWDYAAQNMYETEMVSIGDNGGIYVLTGHAVNTANNYRGYMGVVSVDSTNGNVAGSWTGTDSYMMSCYATGAGFSSRSHFYRFCRMQTSHDTSWVMAIYLKGDLLKVQTNWVIGKPITVYTYPEAQTGWGHKIWSLTPGKVWGILRSEVKKVFGL